MPMPTRVPDHTAARHLLDSEVTPRMAKAGRYPSPVSGDSPEWREKIGKSIERAMMARGWARKEFADKLRRDESQVGRWFTGVERPQFDAIFGIDDTAAPGATIQQCQLIELARLASHGVEITTHITVRRSA